MAQLTEGQKMILDFQDAGYTDQMIKSIKDQRSKAALDQGYAQKDIDAYWGDGEGVGTEVFTNIAKDNLTKNGWKYENLPMADPKNALDVFVASFGISTSGLRYRRPKEQLPPTSEMSWGASFANAGGTLVGDAGDMLLGLTGGAFASGGSPVAAGAASMAYPEAIRRGYLYAYEKGNVSTANILEGMTKAPGEIAKAAVIGGVGGKVGSVAFNQVEKVANPAIAGMAANIAGTVSATGVGAGLNGEMPSIKDFTVAAAMMAMLPGSHYTLANGMFRKVGARSRVEFTAAGERIKNSVQEVWSKTGVKPMDQARIAEVDKIARQSVLGKDVDGQVIVDGAWDKWRQPEPEPYKPIKDTAEKPVEAPPLANKGPDVLDEGDLYYHGSSTAVADKPTLEYSKYGLFGSGIYLTKDKSVAATYQKKGKGKSPGVYTLKANVKNPADMDAPADMAKWRGELEQYYDAADIPEGMTGKQAFKMLEEGIMDNYEMLPAYEGAEMVQDHMRTMGYDSATYVGGIKGGKPHKVLIAFEDEQVSAAKGAPEFVEQFVVAGKVNPDTGVAPVTKVTPEQVDALVDFDAPITPEQAEIVNEAARKYKNEDGSVDLEAVLIEHSAGEPAAQVFRASGRDYSTLDPKTQRFLEYAGKRLEEDGYAPPPKEGAGGGAGGGKPPGEPPKALGGPPEKPFNRAFEFVIEDVNSKVEVSKYATGWRGLLQRFLGSLPDEDTKREVGATWRELSPLTGVDKMLGLAQKLGGIGVETIARLQYSADDRFMFRIEKGGGGYKVVTDKFGKPKYQADYDVPSLYSILSRVDKLEHGREGFRAYMQAQATLDLIKLGKKTTTTLEEAMEVIETVSAKEKKTYAELAHLYQRMMDDSLFGVMSHGGLNDEGFFKFKSERPNYFPQKVYIEPGKVVGGSRLKRLFKKAKGHGLVLKDQFLSTLEILQSRERFNSTNIARLTAVRELQKHFKAPGKDLVVHDPKTKKPATLMLDEDGAPAVDKKFYDFKEGDNVITYYEDGRQKTYEVPDFDGRDVFLKSLLNKNVFERDVAVAFLTKSAKFTRFMITTMPSYVYRMVVRDSFSHATLTKYGGAPYVNLMRGAFDIIDTAAHGAITGGKDLARGKAKFDEAKLNGAVVGGLIAPQFDALLNSYTHMEHTGFGGGVINFASHPVQVLYRGLRMADAAVRVGGTYTGAREKFGSLAAADMARVLGGDFAEKSLSSVMNRVASITPFWTGFQRAGVDAVVKALKNDPTGFGLRGMKYMTATAIAFYALTEVLEDWYDVPEPSRQRNRDRKMADNFLYIPIPWNDELHNFALPVPQGIGAVFISPVHRIMSKLRDQDPRAFKDWVRNVAFSFTGASPGLDNPAINAVLEGASNYDFGFGKPIVPARFENVSDYNAYQPWTSETAKSMSRWIGEPGLNVSDVTPIMIEHILETFTGTAGREGLRIIDAVVKDNRPPKDWANIPFIGSFFLRHPGINAKPINDFYDELDKYRNLKGDVALARKQRDRVALRGAREALRDEANLSKTAEAMQNMRAIAYKIMDDRRMTPDDKRQAIDNLATKMIAVSKSALSRVDRQRWKARIKKMEDK